jgi:5'-3' exonuclease
VAHRLLLDTSSLMYRAFFALPTSITDGRGHSINAMHGYLDMTAYLISAHRPDECVHVYDHDWRPAPRVAAYAGYKAARPPDPEPLPPQFDTLREVLEAFGFSQAEAPGWEAEDAIAALCAKAGRKDRIDIVTGDRDLIQLVRDPVVRVLFTVRGVSKLNVYDEAAVQAKYGVPASRYADFAVLRGDPSDGLPGLAGVGEKTARELVLAYPTLEAMVRDAGADRRSGPPLQRSPRLRATVRDSGPYLEAMRKVVPVKSDIEVTTSTGLRDDERLDELGKRHRLGGPIRRLREALTGGDPSPPEAGRG